MTEPTYTLTQQIIDDAVELLVTSLHHISTVETELMVDTDAMIRKLRSLTPNSGEPVIAWESTTPVYVKYITDAQYQSFSDTARRWYKPYKYSTTAPSTNIEACPKCGETEVGTACSPTCGRRDDYAPSTKPADARPVITPWRDRPEVLAIPDYVEWSDKHQGIIDGAKEAEISELRSAMLAAAPQGDSNGTN